MGFYFSFIFKELLRKTAELYLKDMVQLVFMRLPQFPDVFPANIKQFRMRPGAIEQTRTKRKSRSSFRLKTKNNQTEKPPGMLVLSEHCGQKCLFFFYIF